MLGFYVVLRFGLYFDEAFGNDVAFEGDSLEKNKFVDVAGDEAVQIYAEREGMKLFKNKGVVLLLIEKIGVWFC